jgi:uncharacterized PurR-regulated membrane protein YhhQ (DUF165 family)
MAANWPEIAWVDYVIKLAVSLALFLPLYGVLLGGLSRWLAGVTGDDDIAPHQARARS